jgi:DNA-binding response OmpR family regulator
MKAPENMTREELEEEIAYWRSEFCVVQEDQALQSLRKAFAWTPVTSRYALALREAGGRTVARWLLDGEVPSKQGRDSNSAAVQICLIRRSLGHNAVKTDWGRGYAITPEGAAKLNAVLKPAQEAA